MLESGSQVQNAIYLAGGGEWPVSADDWEARARDRLEQGPFDYVAGGAGSEATVRANREAFERRRLRPRMLTGNAERDLSVEVLGLRSTRVDDPDVRVVEVSGKPFGADQHLGTRVSGGGKHGGCKEKHARYPTARARCGDPDPASDGRESRRSGDVAGAGDRDEARPVLEQEEAAGAHHNTHQLVASQSLASLALLDAIT